MINDHGPHGGVIVGICQNSEGTYLLVSRPLHELSSIKFYNSAQPQWFCGALVGKFKLGSVFFLVLVFVFVLILVSNKKITFVPYCETLTLPCDPHILIRLNQIAKFHHGARS